MVWWYTCESKAYTDIKIQLRCQKKMYIQIQIQTFSKNTKLLFCWYLTIHNVNFTFSFTDSEQSLTITTLVTFDWDIHIWDYEYFEYTITRTAGRRSSAVAALRCWRERKVANQPAHNMRLPIYFHILLIIRIHYFQKHLLKALWIFYSLSLSRSLSLCGLVSSKQLNNNLGRR